MDRIAVLVARSARSVSLRLLLAVGLGAGLLAPSVAVAGNTLYVSDWGPGAVSAFSVGAGGALAPVVTALTGTTASGVAISPSGQDLYVASEGQGTITAFSIDAGGALAQIGTPVASGAGAASEPYGMAITPNGQDLYVADFGEGTVSAFSILAGGGLVKIGTVSSGPGDSPGPAWLAVSPNGQYLYVSNYNAGTVSAFSILADGDLTPIGTVPSGSTTGSPYPERLAISPDGQHLYVPNFEQGTVSTFAILAGGALTQQATPVGSGSSASSGPQGVAISPDGRELYVTNYREGTVSTFSVGAGGALTQQGTPVPSAPAPGPEPSEVAIAPNGQDLFVANFGAGTVSTFAVGVAGALTQQGAPTLSGGSATTASEPYELAVTPDQGPSAAYSATVAPAGSASVFNAQTATGGSAPIATYAWQFGDGASATGRLVRHVFARPGSHTVTLTLTDSDSCSLFGPFTGHSAYCASDAAASTSRTVIVPAPPSASQVSITGVAKRRAELAFTVTAGMHAGPLRTIAVALPRGLSFSPDPQRLADDIEVMRANGRRLKFTGRVRRGVLTITPASAAVGVKVTIAEPELAASESLATQVSRSLHSKHATPVRLTLKLRLIDTSGHSSSLSLRVRVS